MLKARTMMWHPVLLLDQNITLYWNVLGVCCVLLQRYHGKDAPKLEENENETTNVLDSSPAKSHFYFYKAKFAFFQLLDLLTDLRNTINNEIVIYEPSAGRQCSRMSVFF
jgi:hypothetical protein